MTEDMTFFPERTVCRLLPLCMCVYFCILWIECGKGKKGGEKSSHGRVAFRFASLVFSFEQKESLFTYPFFCSDNSQQWQAPSIVTSVISIILPPLPYNVIAGHWADHMGAQAGSEPAWRMQNRGRLLDNCARVYIYRPALLPSSGCRPNKTRHIDK